ncbi:MAG: hypothetical protein H6740_05415 [Alphaproteobacteria bacterium]|nr:hypothetical protein [Alphaproteobacteria bacterium]
MFIERGWPARGGRKLLDRVPEVHHGEPQWQVLSERADAPPLQPAPNAREIEQSGSPAEQLELAERFQAAGSFLRARSILERLRRMDGPWTPRVDDLLWALSGEFAKEDADPLTLAHILVPSLTEAEESDYTESTIHDFNAPRLDDDDTGEDEDEGPAFPSLFRRLEDQPTETETASEVTSVSVMADKEAMRARLLADEDAEEEDEFVEDLYEDGRSGDTQIMLIMRRGGGGEAAEAPDGPAHRRKEDEVGDQLRETLNLRGLPGVHGHDPGGQP